MEIAREVIVENQEILTKLVIKQQFEDHISSDGTPLRDYSPGYRLLKEKMGRSGQTDLDLTGEMHSEMEVTFEGSDVYKIDSISAVDGRLKSEILAEWNEAPIMDLTEENKLVAKEQLTPLFLEKVNERLA